MLAPQGVDDVIMSLEGSNRNPISTKNVVTTATPTNWGGRNTKLSQLKIFYQDLDNPLVDSRGSGYPCKKYQDVRRYSM